MKTLIGIIVALAVIGGGWYYISNMNNQEDVMMEGTMLEGSEMPDNGMVGGDAMIEGDAMINDVVEFTVEGGGFFFSPNVLTVKKGDTVRITFKNVGGLHDFVIDEFDAKTKQISTGAEDVIEFVASEAGSFEYYCSVGNHRAQGMVGTLTVVE